MQDRPDANELLEAIARMLLDDVLPAVGPQLAFRVQVAARSAEMLAREWPADDRAVRAEAGRLVALLQWRPQEPARSWEELREQTWELRRRTSAALRAGELDDRLDDALATLRASVRDKLAVAHPGYDTVVQDRD